MIHLLFYLFIGLVTSPAKSHPISCQGYIQYFYVYGHQYYREMRPEDFLVNDPPGPETLTIYDASGQVISNWVTYLYFGQKLTAIVSNGRDYCWSQFYIYHLSRG